MAGTYTVTVTDANGCTATATTSVVVNSSLTPVASNTGPYCIGGQVQLNVAGGNTYSWSGPNSFADNIQSPVINGATVSTGGTYSVTATDLNGCSGTASTIVAVNGNPTVAPTVAPTAICNGASTTLAANATAGSGSISTYSWSGGLAGNLSGGSVSPTTNTTYTVTVTNSNLCTVTGTVAVVVNANPTVAPTATPGVICNGGSTTLAANAAAGSGSISTYAWSSGLAGNISGGSVSPTTNTTYTVTVTNSNSCTATGTVSVTVNANPTVTPSAVPPAICNGQSTTLAANATAGSGSISTYTWSSGLAANSSGGSVSPTTNTTYTVTVTNSNSCTATGTVSVTVNANPTAAPTAAPAAICNGASTTLAANATAGSGSISTYAWSSGLAGNVSGGGVSPTANTTYTVTVTNSNSCTATATVVVVVNANPTAAPTLVPATICNGQSTTLAANASAGSGSITTYSWSSGLIGSVAGGSVSPASNTTYTITVTNTNNCTATASVAVTVNPLPAPTAGNTGPYCVGNTIQLTSSGASAYAWSGPNSYSNATQNPTLANATTAMGGTYSVTATDANGCSATASTNITINALPLPAASNTGPYCVATNIQLNATGGTTYNWSGPLAFASGTQNPTITGATLAMAGNYTVTVTDANGCSATAVTAVVINNALSPVASNTGPYCAGATIQLNVIGGTGFTWSGPNSFSSSLQNPSLNTSTVAMGGLYSVTATDANGCSGTASTTVVVNSLPTPSASNTGPYCAGATMQLNAAGGTTYTWSGPNSYSNSTQNPSLAGAGAANSGTYSVTVTDANGCSASASTSVVVHALPIPSASNTGPYCAGGTLQLNAAGGATYTWGGPNTFNSAAQNPSVANSTTAMAGVYTVTVTDVNSCSATAATTVIVNANPTAGPAALPATICNGASTTLSANAVAGSGSISTYTWSSGLAGNVSGGSVSPTANTTYTVTVTNSNSCSVSGSVAVTVNQLPQPTAANNGPLCVGATLQLSSSGGSSYAWSGPNAYSNVSQNPAITNATTPLTGTYNVIVTDVNGCSATAATNVVINNALVPAATNTGPYCPGATVQLNVVGGVLYSWSGPAGFSSAVQSPTLSNAATTMSGIYNVTATDANGCSGTASTSVTVNAAPVPVASNAGPFCQGTSVQLNSSGGSTYAWSGPVSYSSGLQNPAIAGATVAMSGVYTVTVTNAANCTATASTTVTVIPAMALATTAGNVSCNAGSNGTVSLVVSSGQSPYSFIWSNTATTQNITGVTAGAYTVTVTDNAGCTATASAVVSQPALLQITETHVNVLCSGAGTGSISISASGGTPAYTFVWNDGVTTQNRTNLIAGPYDVTVTDNNGCSSSVSISITEPPLLTATESHVNVLCNGAATGTITITTAGGTNPLSFLWNDGVITQNRSNLIAAGYTLTVTDNNACTASVSVIINEPTAQTVNETHTDVACGGATPGSINVTNSGGVAPYTYLWNDGGTTPVRTNIAAGNYSLTVTDNNACTATIAIIINTGSGLAFNETHTNVLCFGGVSGTITTTTTGGTSPYTYTWNDGVTTQNRANLVAGNYTVTVYDNTTCSISATINITEPTVLNVYIAHTNVACFGGNTGTITVSPSGGTAPYSFVWNDGVILQNRTAMAAGNYSVTVSDNNSCTFSASATITEPNALSVTETHSDVLCNGGNTGAVNLAVSGGTSPYTYIWNDGSTLPNRVNLVAAGYSVTVTDNNLCSASASVTIAEPLALLTSETHANVLCNGGSNGSINTTVSGGVSPYTYLWSDAATLPDRVNLTAANYGVTIQDNNNCSSVLNIAITEPTALVVSETHNNILCNAQNTGAINVTTSGATIPYTFNWNDGITIEDRANLSAGSYNLTVTDNNACSISLSVSITEPTALVTTETHVDVACNGGSTGSIDVTVSGATAPYTYSWNDGVLTPDRINIPSGIYSVTISDNNACSASLAVTISSASGLSISETHNNATCNSFADAGINVVVLGGTSPYTYLWNDGVVSQNRSNITAGNYSVSVTDNNGCVITRQVIITEPTALVISEGHTNILCNAQNTGSINVTTSGATLPYTFNWNDGITTEDRTNLSAGNYNLTVTDDNACSVSLSVSISEPTALVTSETHVDVACNGGSTGSIDVTVSGATAPYTYSWNDGVITPDRVNIPSGSYSVTISDNNVCSASLAVTISTSSGLSISETHTNATCNAFADAAINVVVLGGTQPYSYLWNDGVVTQNRSNITAGNYSVSVTDNNGCAVTRQVIISEPTALSVTEVHSSVLCNGGNTGSVNVTASGATQPYTYLWNDAVTTEDRVSILAGNYSITVTDNNACSASISASITEPAALILSEVHTDVLCNGGNTASINLTPAGGVSPYIYQWNDAESTQDRNGIGAGNYSVTVADNNGCTGLLNISIVQPAVVAVSETHGDILCNNGNNGWVNLSVAGGTTPYNFIWNIGATVEDPTNMIAGNYAVTVTDNNSCSASLSVALLQPTAIALAEVHTNVSCNGYSDGSISLNVSGGTPGYTYQWNDAVTSQNRFNLPAGNYTVTVMDINLCSAVTGAIITQPAGMALNSSFINPTCETNNADGSISLAVSGGSFPYTFNWSNGATSTSLANLDAGNYQVTVTDGNTCSVSATFTLIYQYDFSVQATPSVTINIGENTTLGYTLNGAAGNYVSVWSPSYGLDCIDCVSPIASPAVTTIYQIQVTNEAGCVAMDDVTVYVVPDYSVFVPNVFTPNGDGNNDVFEIYGNLKGLAFLEVQIFNRWGEKVFESNNHQFKWDGTFKGVMQNPAVFVWQLKLSFLDGHKEELRKGSVTLLR
jgi:gliding motility-associated-like protein